MRSELIYVSQFVHMSRSSTPLLLRTQRHVNPWRHVLSLSHGSKEATVVIRTPRLYSNRAPSLLFCASRRKSYYWIPPRSKFLIRHWKVFKHALDSRLLSQLFAVDSYFRHWTNLLIRLSAGGTKKSMAVRRLHYSRFSITAQWRSTNARDKQVCTTYVGPRILGKKYWRRLDGYLSTDTPNCITPNSVIFATLQPKTHGTYCGMRWEQNHPGQTLKGAFDVHIAASRHRYHGSIRNLPWAPIRIAMDFSRIFIGGSEEMKLSWSRIGSASRDASLSLTWIFERFFDVEVEFILVN